MTLSGEQRERPKRTPPGTTELVGRSWRKPGGEMGLEHGDRGKQPWITAAPGPEAERYDRGHPVVRPWTAGDAFLRDAAGGASAELGEWLGTGGLDGAEGSRGSVGEGSAQEEDGMTRPQSPRCSGSEVTSLAQPGAAGRVWGIERSGHRGGSVRPGPCLSGGGGCSGEDRREAGVPLPALLSPEETHGACTHGNPRGPQSHKSPHFLLWIRPSGIQKLTRLFKSPQGLRVPGV